MKVKFARKLEVEVAKQDELPCVGKTPKSSVAQMEMRLPQKVPLRDTGERGTEKYSFDIEPIRPFLPRKEREYEGVVMLEQAPSTRETEKAKTSRMHSQSEIR